MAEIQLNFKNTKQQLWIQNEKQTNKKIAKIDLKKSIYNWIEIDFFFVATPYTIFIYAKILMFGHISGLWIK